MNFAFRSTSTCCFGLELLLSLAVVPGEPWAPHRAAAMLKQSEPTSSTLQLVASDMTGIMEKLDTHELDLDDGEYDTADTPAPGVLPLLQLRPFPVCFFSPLPPLCCPAAEHLPLTVVYHTVGFKEPKAKVFLSAPITAKILEVERFTSAQDRFYATTQRSINKVTLS